MLPRILDSFALVLLWVCSLVAIVVLAGMAIVVVPIGWAPLFLYACLGLVCGWIMYRRTTSASTKPVSQTLAIQSLFALLVSLSCFLLGMFDLFGFSHHASQVAALPVILFAILFIRRAVLSGSETPKGKAGIVAKFVLLIAYLWMLIAIVYVGASMLSTFMMDSFTGMSMLISPLNGVSWVIIYLWFLPAFILRALGNRMRGAADV